MSKAVADIRAVARIVPLNREMTVFAGGLLTALAVGAALADLALNGAVTPMIR